MHFDILRATYIRRIRHSLIQYKQKTDTNDPEGDEGGGGFGETSQTTQVTNGTQSTRIEPRYVAFGGAMNDSLPLFDASIAEGYAGDSDKFKEDLASTARYYLNAVISSNTGDYWQATVAAQAQLQATSNATTPPSTTSGSGFGIIDGTTRRMRSVTAASGTTEGLTVRRLSMVGSDVNAYDTSTSTDGVNEADKVASDGQIGKFIL
jgi:hypothetical protein